ncbi:MAG TPA: thiamine phosphate synthase [Chloroflexota bacterium]|nr:thiamine phosphate synthase [Chloroflexota bacterium]
MSEARARRLTILRAAGLYLVTDDRQTPEARRRVVAEALAAGVRVVQLRDKTAMGGALLAEAEDLAALCHAHGAVLIVNDRADVAVAAGADGVHVGQGDLPLAAARRVVGDDLLVGVSASFVEEAVAAERDGADYVGFGAMFATPTKEDAEYAGPALLAEARERTRLPLVAIGGITAENAPAVLAARPDLLAVVSAVSGASEPGAAARELLALIRAAQV